MVDDSKPRNNTGGRKEGRRRKRRKGKEKNEDKRVKRERESMNILYLPAEKSTQETKKESKFQVIM